MREPQGRSRRHPLILSGCKRRMWRRWSSGDCLTSTPGPHPANEGEPQTPKAIFIDGGAAETHLSQAVVMIVIIAYDLQSSDHDPCSWSRVAEGIIEFANLMFVYAGTTLGYVVSI